MNELEQLYENIQEHSFLKFLKNPKKLAFYGAGRISKLLLEIAKPYHLPVEIIVDTYKEGEAEGISIIKADKFFAEEDSGNYKFLITTPLYLYTVGRELVSRGIDNADIYAPSFQSLINGLGLHDFIVAQAYFQVLDFAVNKQHYFNVYNHFLDDNSKKVYVAILKYRIYGTYEIDKELYAPDDSYFHERYITLSGEECYVDVGAYIGDSIVDFLMKTEHEYKKIYAIEGNSEYCEKIKQRLYMECRTGKLKIYNVGAGSKRETINYDGYRGGMGDGKLEIYTLDELLQGERVSLIKMDIEGMEMQALEGGAKIIKEQKPMLAICVYHLLRDIWEIPEKIITLCPKYKFRLQQSVNVWMSETVLYASVNEEKLM